MQVYREPFYRRYYAPWYSWAAVFRFLLYAGIIVLSFVIAYATGNFWYKTNTDLITPTVHYSGDALLVLEGATAGTESVWSTSVAVRETFASRLLSASVQVGEVDDDFDGRPESIRFLITAQPSTPVYGAKLLVQFSYRLQGLVRLDMYSLAYVAHSAGTPGGALYADGDLRLRQIGAIPEATYHQAYFTKLLNSSAGLDGAALTTPGAGALSVQSVVAAYLDRNVTTALASDHPVWAPANGNAFSMDVRVRIPADQVVLYRPQAIQMLKFAWIQFLSAFAVLWWLASWAEYWLFRYRVLEARPVSDVAPKVHKY